MFFLMICRPSLNMGHAGSETRSLDQIEGKSCEHFGCHIFCFSRLKFCQNVCLNYISRSSSKMGHIGSETRSMKENIVQTPEAAFLL